MAIRLSTGGTTKKRFPVQPCSISSVLSLSKSCLPLSQTGCIGRHYEHQSYHHVGISTLGEFCLSYLPDGIEFLLQCFVYISKSFAAHVYLVICPSASRHFCFTSPTHISTPSCPTSPKISMMQKHPYYHFFLVHAFFLWYQPPANKIPFHTYRSLDVALFVLVVHHQEPAVPSDRLLGIIFRIFLRLNP